jgi:hypothetical protein
MANARSQAERNVIAEMAKEGWRSIDDFQTFLSIRRRLFEISAAQQAIRRK